MHDATASGATVVIASHDTDRATALSTRVLTVAGHTTEAQEAEARDAYHAAETEARNRLQES